MVHTAWTSQAGAPQAVSSLVEDHDGVLWIGSESGLYSFDGNTFSAFRSEPNEPSLPPNAILSLFVAKNGDLWVGIFLEGIARISNGHVQIYRDGDGLPIRQVLAIQQAPDGTIWCLTDRNLFRFDEAASVWRKQPTPTNDHRFFLIDPNGTQWLGEHKGWYRRPPDAEFFTVVPGRAGIPLAIVAGQDGDVVLNEAIMPDDVGQTRRFDRSGNTIKEYDLKSELWSMAFTLA